VASVVEEDVAFGPENLGLSPREIKERVESSFKNSGTLGFKTQACSRFKWRSKAVV